MAPVAKAFDKIIKDGRERKKNEALASQIFSKSRRQSAPSQLKPGTGPSLASRVGVRKIPQRAIASGRRASVPAGNVNGEWTHDLHGSVNGGTGKKAASAATQGLGWRVSLTEPSGGAPTSRRAAARKAKMAAAAADAMDVDSGGQVKGKAGKAARSQVNVIPAPATAAATAQGISIRGLAGPFAVIGQNFAPGTTPADVESAMSPIGGDMVSCTVIKSHPFLMMEMVFSSKEGGERVVETFNNKTADGRILKVYPKVGGYQPNATSSFANAPPTGPKASRNQQQQGGNSQVVDGTMGFSNSGAMQANSSNSGSRSGGGDLFSDKLIGSTRVGRGGRRRARS